MLQKNDSAYTLRRVNHFLPVSLEAIYERLNAMDPNAGGSRSGNRWGGSEQIGGSPRASGTGLTAQQIVEICSTAYRKPTRVGAAFSIARAAGVHSEVAPEINAINTVWTLVAAFLVFCMQVGFEMLEAGFARRSHSAGG